MSAIRLLLPLVGILVIMQPAWADEQDACASNAGTFLIGTVISNPRFVHGHDLRGVELSHTHVRLRGDNGMIYDIAIDDVFADGYDQAGETVPAPLSRIRPGARLELCGKPYASGGPGMGGCMPPFAKIGAIGPPAPIGEKAIAWGGMPGPGMPA